MWRNILAVLFLLEFVSTNAHAQAKNLLPADFPARFASTKATVQKDAAKTYAQECRGRQRHVFRRAREGWQGYQRL